MTNQLYKARDIIGDYVIVPIMAGGLLAGIGFFAADVPRDAYALIKNKGVITYSTEPDVPEYRKIKGISGLEIPLEKTGVAWGALIGGLGGLVMQNQVNKKQD